VSAYGIAADFAVLIVALALLTAIGARLYPNLAR